MLPREYEIGEALKIFTLQIDTLLMIEYESKLDKLYAKMN